MRRRSLAPRSVGRRQSFNGDSATRRKTMSDIDLDRRVALGLGVGIALAAAGGATNAVAQTAPATFTPKPLPFDPKAIPGLSEKILVSHHDNNYAGAVRRLGAIEAEIAKADPATAPGF